MWAMLILANPVLPVVIGLAQELLSVIGFFDDHVFGALNWVDLPYTYFADDVSHTARNSRMDMGES